MLKRVFTLSLPFLGLALFSGWAGWAFFASAGLNGGLRTLSVIWPYLMLGGLLTAAAAGLYMWLAFYSANHGYDDRQNNDGS
jgi:hypothetical protein